MLRFILIFKIAPRLTMEVFVTEISDFVHVTGEIFVQVQGKRENTAV